MHSYKKLFLILIAFTYMLPVQARIGDAIESFQDKFGRIYKLKEHNSKDNKIYYIYALVKDPIQQKSSPGFASGMTLTTSGGKIIGESLIIHMGDNQDIGKIMAAAMCLDLTYEAIGRPLPTTTVMKDSEFNAYYRAVNETLSGSPQTIQYKGCPMRITVAKTKTNDLLLAITPAPPAPKP